MMKDDEEKKLSDISPKPTPLIVIIDTKMKNTATRRKIKKIVKLKSLKDNKELKKKS